MSGSAHDPLDDFDATLKTVAKLKLTVDGIRTKRGTRLLRN